MSGLLNSYLDAGFTPTAPPVYGVAGAPNPLNGDGNSIKGKYLSSTTAGGASGYAGLYDGGYNNGALLSQGARLNHTDPTMLLQGYWLSTLNRRLTATVEYALYKLPNPTGAIGSGNVPALVPETVLPISLPNPGNQSNFVGAYYPLPAPIELPLGTYVLMRTSPDGTGTDIDFYSYASAASLPSTAMFAAQGVVDPPANWPTNSDITSAGPYWEHTVMAPYDPRPPVVVNFFTSGKNALALASGSGASSVSAQVTLNQDITGNRAVIIPVSSVSTAHRVITGLTLGGVDGKVLVAPVNGASAAIIGFWPASSGLTAGVHTLTMTLAQTTTNILSARAPVYELDNVNQDPAAHYFAYTSDTAGAAGLRAVAGVPDKYFDGFFGSCVGGASTAQYYPSTAGVMARYGEFGCDDNDTTPPYKSALIPATPSAWGLFYALTGSSGQHTFPFAMVTRA